MTKKVLVATSLTAIFAASMIMVPAFASGHLTIDDISVENRGNNGKAQSVHIDVGGTIPVPPDGSDYGWAVATSNGGFLVITSHPNIGDDSTAQPPAAKYHTHYLTAAGGGDCGGLPFATFATKNEVGRLSIMDDKLWVENVPRGLAGDLLESGFGFTLFTSPTGLLCIDPV